MAAGIHFFGLIPVMVMRFLLIYGFFGELTSNVNIAPLTMALERTKD